MPGQKRPRTAAAWDHFTPNAEFTEGKCQRCNKIIKTTGGATSGLYKHLESRHNIFLNGIKKAETELKPFNAVEVISKLAATDGNSFNSIATSEVLHGLYEAATQTKLPTSPSSIQNAVLQSYTTRRQELIQEFNQMKAKGMKFSVSLDEWTSMANRRYVGINLHVQGKFWSLGLQRINGSFNAEECLSTLATKLNEFQIPLDCIYGIVSDGASVMQKFGRIAGKRHQLCFAHAIHLAVSDVLYKKSSSSGHQEGISTSSQDVDDFDSPFADAEAEIEFAEDYVKIINEVRRIARKFHRSPLKAERLASYAENQNEVKMILDTRTRWNSVLDMLERFYKLKDAIKKTLIDFQDEIKLSEFEMNMIRNLIASLRPVQVATEAICRRETTLVTADVMIDFMLEKLAKAEDTFGIKLYNAMRKRILERRTILSDVASFLNYAGDLAPDNLNGYFVPRTEAEMISEIKTIFEEHSEDEISVTEATDQDENTEASQSLLDDLSLEAELNLAISNAKTFRVNQHLKPGRDLKTKIKKEIQLMQSTGQLGKILTYVNDLVLSVPPSSVEVERVFSSANNFCNKTRSKLGDESLNALVFLRSYFKNSK